MAKKIVHTKKKFVLSVIKSKVTYTCTVHTRNYEKVNWKAKKLNVCIWYRDTMNDHIFLIIASLSPDLQLISISCILFWFPSSVLSTGAGQLKYLWMRKHEMILPNPESILTHCVQKYYNQLEKKRNSMSLESLTRDHLD